MSGSDTAKPTTRRGSHTFWTPFHAKTQGAYYRVLLRGGGWVVRLHKFTMGDSPHYHSHPAGVAFRLILRGGYIEETSDGLYHAWTAGRMGLARATFSHRIAAVLEGRPCYTLWVRGPKRHEVVITDAPPRVTDPEPSTQKDT